MPEPSFGRAFLPGSAPVSPAQIGQSVTVIDPAADRLLDEAGVASTSGWDFSFLDGRFDSEGPSWDFGSMVDAAIGTATTMLDLGTGGGEFLDARPVLPRLTVAVEAWPPNVAVAAARLRPRGVAVVQVTAEEDNPAHGRDVTGRLPFRAGTFAVVIARHEAFVAGEVARVLRSGGRFLTQQASSGSDQFHQLLGLAPPHRPALDLDLLVAQVRGAGLMVDGAGIGTETLSFADIGALAWYLRRVPWAVPGFDIVKHRDALVAAASQPLVVYQERYWLSAHRD